MKHAVALTALAVCAIIVGCAWQTHDFTATQLPICESPFILTGRIVELSSNYPVSGAEVVLLMTDKYVRSDAAGYFRLCGVEPGRYQLRIGRSGYQTWISEFIVVDTSDLEIPPVKLKNSTSMAEQIIRGLIGR